MQDRLSEALRLSECPKIQALLDRCLLEPTSAGNTITSTCSRSVDNAGGATISVASLISFIETDHGRGKQLLSSHIGGRSSVPKYSPPPTAPAWTLPDAVQMDPKGLSSLSFTHATPVNAATYEPRETWTIASKTPSTAMTLSPRVVPLTSKWAMHGVQNGRTPEPVVAGGHASAFSGANSRAEEERFRQRQDGEGDAAITNTCRQGHCTTLVRHLGTVLGLRGKHAHRRPGAGQPVWRKKETLIQERIVQYTTLDEEGTVR